MRPRTCPIWSTIHRSYRGAHLDSWTFGTGATDNAAGSAVIMEAMRVLMSLKLQPRRTIQVALWTGEEQGALGSKSYVQQHFQIKDNKQRDALSVYFNIDGGTGKIRGVFNARNSSVVPIFDAWMTPFKESGMKTVSPCDIGGGDQKSFENVGLPSFGFIQDPIEYNSRTHHTSADVYERIQSEDMRFNAAVLASFAWQAAQRDEKLPRTDLTP
jgi:carboxypeptidase Q